MKQKLLVAVSIALVLTISSFAFCKENDSYGNSDLARIIIEIFSEKNKDVFFRILSTTSKQSNVDNNTETVVNDQSVDSTAKTTTVEQNAVNNPDTTTKEQNKESSSVIEDGNNNIYRYATKNSKQLVGEIKDFNDPKKIYKARIDEIKMINGEKYATFNCFEDGLIDFKLNKNIDEYEEDMLAFFKVSNAGRISIKKKVYSSTLSGDNVFVVNSVEDEDVFLNKDNLILSLEDDYFETLNQKYKISAYKCFYVECLTKKGKYTFENVEETTKDKIKLEVDDKIIFDATNKMMIVFRVV